MQEKAILAFAIVTLFCVDLCEGITCYACNSTSEDGCGDGNENRRLRFCGSEEISRDNFGILEDYDLNSILRTFKRKKRFFETNKTKYMANFTMTQEYIDDIQYILNLNRLPPPVYVDEIDDIVNEKHDAIDKYKAILTRWKKVENAKVVHLWNTLISPKLDELKAAWKGKMKMLDPPEWSDALYSAGRWLEYDEYKEYLDQWIDGATKSIAAGNFTYAFIYDLNYKWSHDRYTYDSYYENIPVKREVPHNDGSLFENLPIDKSWCARFQSPKLGVRLGCGVQLEGFEFENGCHEMSAPHEGVKYCRCDDYICSGETLKKMFEEYDKLLSESNKTLAWPDLNLTYSDSAGRSPCFLTLAVALCVTVTSCVVDIGLRFTDYI